MARDDFHESVVVVTGASTGLGRAIAVEVARRGAAAVVVNYASSREEANETARLVEEQGAQALVQQGDVAQDADCRAIVAAAAPFGRIDALFNNAGATVLAPDHSDLDAVSAEDFLRLYRVNVVGAYQMIRAARSLLESGPRPGAVVNTASVAALNGIGTSVPYAASKAAMTTMTLSLARALGPRIRVNAICPGFMDTPWFSRIGRAGGDMEELRERIIATMPLQVASTAEDVAVSAVFLGSPDSRHMTGEIMTIDAGMHLGAAAPRPRPAQN